MSDLLHHGLEHWAARTPDAPALIDGAQALSYRQLDHDANRFRRLFTDHGVTPGDRIVLALENGATFVAAYMGILKAGAVAVPMPPGPRSDRLAAAIDDCAPRICVVDAATARGPGPREALARVALVFVDDPEVLPADAPASYRTLGAALPRDAADTGQRTISATDLAAIIYTSGSTGTPKGVMLSHGNFVSNARAIVAYLQLTAADRVLCVLPFSYVYGLSLLHTHLLVGGSLALENRAAFPNVVLDALQRHAATGFAGVPSTFALLLHRSKLDEAQLPALRYVTQAGGPMPAARITEWLARGPRADFFVMYGATEAAARLTYLPPADLVRKAGSIGRPIEGVTVRIVSEAGEDVAPGAVGELVASGPNISRGYWHDPDETARRFDRLGYRTGDLGYADADGFLFLVGRSHDMIKVGANRVGAREIEDVLNRHAAVRDAAVVGAPHDLLGEAPVAFVVLGSTLADPANTLRAYCAEQLAPYKVPVRVVVLDALPTLPASGKIARAELTRRARESEDAPARGSR